MSLGQAVSPKDDQLITRRKEERDLDYLKTINKEIMEMSVTELEKLGQVHETFRKVGE